MYRHPPTKESSKVKGPSRGPAPPPSDNTTTSSSKPVLAQPRDLSWDEFKKQYKHKLDFDGTKEMMEWRKQLDAERDGKLKEKRKKKRKRQSDSSEDDDSDSDSDDDSRKRKKKKKKKRKKKKKK